MKNLIRILMVGGAMVTAGFIVGCDGANKMASTPGTGGKMKDGDGKMMEGKMKDGEGKMMGGEGKMKDGEGKMMGGEGKMKEGEEKMKDMKGKDGK